MVIIRERGRERERERGGERDRMDKTLAFLVLFFNHKIAKRKYNKRRKMSNTILFRLIQ